MGASDLHHVGEFLGLGFDRLAARVGPPESARSSRARPRQCAWPRETCRSTIATCSRGRWDESGFFDPITPPAISMARLEMTSLTFMLVCVPLPVCQMRSGNWSSSLPGDDFVGGLHDQLGLFRRQLAQILVHQRAGLFQDAEGADQLRRHDVAANIEMNQRTLRSARPSRRSSGLRSCPMLSDSVRVAFFAVISLMSSI